MILVTAHAIDSLRSGAAVTFYALVFLSMLPLFFVQYSGFRQRRRIRREAAEPAGGPAAAGLSY